MSNEIDILMDLDPLSLTRANVDDIIAYHREARARKAEGGGRSRAKKDTGPKLALGDLVKSMVADKAPAQPLVKRRI